MLICSDENSYYYHPRLPGAAGPRMQVVRTLTAGGHHYVIRSGSPQQAQVVRI